MLRGAEGQWFRGRKMFSRQRYRDIQVGLQRGTYHRSPQVNRDAQDLLDALFRVLAAVAHARGNAHYAIPIKDIESAIFPAG